MHLIFCFVFQHIVEAAVAGAFEVIAATALAESAVAVIGGTTWGAFAVGLLG